MKNRKRQTCVCGGTEIVYDLVRSGRKTIGITVGRDGGVTVRAPYGTADAAVNKVITVKAAWIMEKQGEMRAQASPVYTEEERKYYFEKAAARLQERVSYYAGVMGETNLGAVRLKELKSRWGSCSIRRNLNFNWKLILAPDEVLDYVVVHELCHLREMNHSSRFWKLVEQYCPDYQEHRRWLREEGRRL